MKLIVTLAVIIFIIVGCDSNPTDSEMENNFSIFLAKDIENNSPTKSSLDKIILEDEPLLSSESIESYEWTAHKITYSNEAKEKIKSNEPLFGRCFIVIAQNQRIYWGLFTDGASSMGCNNPVIMVWSRAVLDTSFVTNEFVIDRAYPEYIGNKNDKDLRQDVRIYNALKVSHKLK